MVSKMEPVNAEISILGAFAERLVAERTRLKWSQTDLRARTGVGKLTQIRYEKGETSPGIDYLATLDGLGFDVMYLITGVRGSDSLDAELQNLVDAYSDAPDAVRRSAWGVLISPYSRDVERAKAQPGWFKHEVRGEHDARYKAREHIAPMTVQEKGPESMFPGQIDPEEGD